MSLHTEDDSGAQIAASHSGVAPTGVAAPDPTPTTNKPTRSTRSRVTRRWLIVGGLTLVLAVPVGIGVAAAAGGGASSGTGAGTGPAGHMTGIASCPATCVTGTAGGMAQHMRQMSRDPADMAEHWKNMMGGRGTMMGPPSAVPSSP